MSIPKRRHQVRKNDMNALINQNFEFTYGGLFRSTEDWIHPTRTEITYEIIYVTQGEVFMSEEAREIHAKKGELVILSPNISHTGTRHSKDVGFYWVHFKAKVGLPFEERFFDGFDSAYLFKELIHACHMPTSPDYLTNSILVRILAELCLLSSKNLGKYDSTAERIYEWIRINASAKLTAKQVSQHFGYSSDHICRICKKNYGVGARELINKFLLLRAKELLSNTDKYVKEIAADLEFGDDKCFIGYFKYHEGISPSEFRNRYGKIHMNNK